ncbi:MAG TPA: IPT/TIG domain-containing protein [Thermoanaerobaculia bacterium]|nr:IPT/TIG domain-containing protein [Thermoanaerobaculia bacterium]
MPVSRRFLSAVSVLFLLITTGSALAWPSPGRFKAKKPKSAAPSIPVGPVRKGPFPAAPYAGPPPLTEVKPVRTPPLRTMPALPPPRRGDEVEKFEPPHPQRPTDTPKDDGRRQQSRDLRASAPVSTGLSFEGVGAGMPGYSVSAVPPDTNGHVGATQYVQWNNLSFAIWDKQGNKLYGPAAGNTLFQPLGGVCASHNDGDPVVNYDIMAGRWVLSQLVVYASPNFSHQCIAVSMTSDATGSWYLYDFATGASDFVDYPKMAVWSDAYYMSAHIFGGGGSYYAAGRIYAFERDKMLNGQPARMLSADLKQYGGLPQYGFLPADVDSAQAPPPGEAEFVIGPDPASTNMLDSTRVAVTWGGTPTISLTETQINASWGIPPCVGGSGTRACVPQPPPASSGAYLDNLDQAFMYRLAYRNFGGTPTQESLVANITVPGSASSPSHGAVRWFEFRNDGSSTATPTVYQASTFDPDSDYRWMGSIAMDKDHNIALGYTKSSLTVNPSIWVNGRLGTDPLNTLGTETEVKAGGGVQTAYNRWGDYSSMTLDPIDQCTFWFTSEYLLNNGTYNWATRIASFKFPSCTPESWGNVSGTVTGCASGAPVPGVAVTLTGGYSAVTDAAGHYTVAVPAGTYSASAAATDKNCTSSSPATVSVVVPADGSVSQDFCMNGTAKLEFSADAVDDAPHGNGNGIVNRNECVNLSVTLANNGCAMESAINGTLTTSTAGVTVTQGSSFYPNVAAGATAANTIPFTFQTSSSFVCGTDISFTLNVTAAGGNKSVTFTVPTCGGGAGLAIPPSSITATDPTQADRLTRDGVSSTCSGKTCYGPLYYGPQRYKTFKFTNSSNSARCVTVNIHATCGSDIESVAYQESVYDPPQSTGDARVCNNYLGDSGIGGLGTAITDTSYSFTVAAQKDFILVFNTADPNTTCTSFSGSVTGLIDDTPGPGACPTCVPPATPTITPAGPTTFCAGGSVTLNSSAASGNQWYLNGGIIAGATGASVVANATGSYTVTTTTNGCISAPSTATAVTVNAIPAAPVPSNSGPFCAGSTIALSAPTIANATYAWTGPNGFTSALQNPTRANATAADAGTYSLTVTVNGCTSPAGTTSVVVNPIPSTPSPSNGGPYCAGGTISLSTPTVSGAAYHWTGPNGFTSALQNPTRANATLADAGTYFVTVTVNGCPSAGGTTSVVVSSVPATPLASNGGPYCAGATIALSTPTVANATYAWTGPNGFTSALQNPTRASATAADAGTYSVTVTVNGCASAAGSTSVAVNTSIPATPTASNSGPFCEGATISLSTPTVASATYAWTGPNGFTSALQNPTRANATAADGGTYSVTVTVGGCTSAAGTTSVSVTPKPATPAASNGGPYCEGSTIALSTPLVATATYAWTGPNGFTSTQQNPTRANATAADFGVYSVTVTVNGCTSAAGTTTVLDGNAAATATNDGPYCAGGTITLSTPTVAGATYAWTGPNNYTSAQQNPTIASATPADAGTYSVIVTAPGCTSLAGSTNVVVNSAATTPAPTNGGPYCTGGTIALSTATVAGATYAWTGPNGFTSALQNPTIPNATLAAAGIYSVTIFNGCTSPTGTTTVAVSAPPTTPVPTNGGPYCLGGTIALSTPTVASATYAWTGPNGFTSTLQNPTRANATAADAGTYSVTVTVDGCTSAAGTTSVVLTNGAAPLPANGGPYCTGSTIALATPIVPGATYAWTGPNGFTSTLPNPTRAGATVADAGVYSVTVTANGCTSPAGTTTVVVNAIPAAPTASNGGPYCTGGTIALSTATVAGATYAWTGPNGFTSALQNPTIASATTANGGAYSLTVTVNGCTSPAGTTNVVVNAVPATPTATNSGPYCTGSTISLSTPAVTGATYAWTGPNGYTASVRNATRSNVTTADAGAYSVTVTVNGCPSAAGTTTVVVNQKPAAPVASNTGPYCSGDTVQLNATTVAGATYAWTGPNGFTSALQNPTITSATSAATGTYSVTASANGCTSTAATTAVSVTAKPVPQIYPGGSTTSCSGGYVYLYCNYSTGVQWRLNGTPIANATNSFYYASVAGSYDVVVTQNSCGSVPSNAIVVTITPPPSAAITTPATLTAGAAGTASIADAGPSAYYSWSISNGFIDSGYGTRTISYTVGSVGAVSLSAYVSVPGCSDQRSVTVKIAPDISTVSPANGVIAGGTPLTITGSGFQVGAAVSVGGAAATNVQRVSSTTLTAITPVHTPGAVNVVVTNPDAVTATKTNAFTYLGKLFDPNNDSVIDSADIFYLVNYLFTGGPAPAGGGGAASGDANGDGVCDAADIFYLVNYIFTGGPAPMSVGPAPMSAHPAPNGSITLGAPIVREGRTFIPVIVSGAPHALSLRVRGANVVGIRRTVGVTPLFETAPKVSDGAAYLVSFGEKSVSGVVAEIEVTGAPESIELDPALTMLTDQSGMQKATAANGHLRLGGKSQ